MSVTNDHRRDNAVRLLCLWVSRDMRAGATIGNASVLDLAAQNGFDDQELLSGLNYAAEHNWITVGGKGLQLMESGAAATICSSDVAA